MLVAIRNPHERLREVTTISVDTGSNNSAATVKNNQGFTANDYAVFGKGGEETTELRRITSLSGVTTLNLSSALSFSHALGTPVGIISYNQVEISRKTSKSGAWTVLGTVDLEMNSSHTNYINTNGQDTDFYKARFFNLQTGQYSDYSPELKGSGFTTRAVKQMIDTVLSRLRDPNGEFNSRETVLYEIQLKYEKVTSRLIQASAEYYRKTIEIPMQSFKYEYTLPDDFREVHEIRDGDGNIVLPLPQDVLGGAKLPGYEMTDTQIMRFNDVPTPSSTDDVPTTVHECDNITVDGTWAISLDATNLTLDEDEFKSGTGSLNFDLDVSLDSGNTGAITNSTMTAQDLSDFEDSGKWRLWVYIPDITYFSSVTFRWGSSSANYWELIQTTDYKKNAFHDGWNLMEFDWASDSVTETGTGASTGIDYLQVRYNYSARQDDMTDVRLDGIRIANTWQANDVYRVTYFRNPAAISSEMDELDIPFGYGSVLLNGVVSELLIGYENRDTLAGQLRSEFRKDQSEFTSQAAKRTRRPIGMRPFGRRRNYSSRPLGGGRSVHTNYDVPFPRDN